MRKKRTEKEPELFKGKMRKKIPQNFVYPGTSLSTGKEGTEQVSKAPALFEGILF
jgi:hypothetical protein